MDTSPGKKNRDLSIGKRLEGWPLPLHPSIRKTCFLPCTLVFCSVNNPLRGLQEILRVLKPGGQFLLVEHVRAQGRFTAFAQDLLTPFTRLFLGNCHWNRRTEQTVYEAGFQEVKFERRVLVGGLLPVLILVARR
jgi:SAM-dependent methyltransferase